MEDTRLTIVLGSPGWGVSNTKETPPALPPRISPVPSLQAFSQSRVQSSNSLNSQQSWQLPGPPSHPPAPQASQVAPAAYNPNTYGLMPSARQSPVNPTWSQRNSSGSTSDASKRPISSESTSDSSKRAAQYIHNYLPGSAQAPKPPLPVRNFCLYLNNYRII